LGTKQVKITPSRTTTKELPRERGEERAKPRRRKDRISEQKLSVHHLAVDPRSVLTQQLRWLTRGEESQAKKRSGENQNNNRRDNKPRGGKTRKNSQKVAVL